MRRAEPRGGYRGAYGAERRRAKDRQGVALIVVSLALAVALGVAIFAFKPKPYDEATLCPAERLPARTMLLVDRSDALIGADRVRRLISDAADALPVHGRLTIFQLGPTGDTVGDPLFDLCNPGRGAQVSAVYRNPRRVETFYQEQFGDRLDVVVDEITRPIETETSPIVEAIAELLRLSRDGAGAERVDLVLVSDFLQNTTAFGSAYRGDLDPEGAAAFLAAARRGSEARIEAVVMQRDGQVTRQENARTRFWEPLAAEAGVEILWR